MTSGPRHYAKRLARSRRPPARNRRLDRYEFRPVSPLGALNASAHSNVSTPRTQNPLLGKLTCQHVNSTTRSKSKSATPHRSKPSSPHSPDTPSVHLGRANRTHSAPSTPTTIRRCASAWRSNCGTAMSARRAEMYSNSCSCTKVSDFLARLRSSRSAPGFADLRMAVADDLERRRADTRLP